MDIKWLPISHRYKQQYNGRSYTFISLVNPQDKFLEAEILCQRE